MKSMIMKFVKSVGVLVQLRSKKYTGVVDYYLIDWLGCDGHYYSLLVICNETQLFMKRIEAIGDSMDEISTLTSGLRQFDEKIDWVLGKWKIEDAVKYDNLLIKCLNGLQLDNCDKNGYEVNTFVVAVRPAAQYVISYAKGVRTYTLSLTLGERGSVLADSEEHKEFLLGLIEATGLGKYYDVRL